ncbi:MAG: DUF2868 domain-containing protein [Rhodoferax sp.]|nr:DUF2868 domain-containing protein [Rhodoferax sp.]
MTESEALDVVAVRVIESADQDRSVWSDADRAWASHEAAAAVGEAAEPGVFLAHRARLAMGRLNSRMAALGKGVHALAWKPWLGIVIVLAAFLVGLLADRVGSAQRINVLAPPVLLLLVWNLLVYLFLLTGPLWRGAAGHAIDPLRSLVAHLGAGWHGTRKAARDTSVATWVAKVAAEWAGLTANLYALRAARMLHLAAAALAVGIIAGLYLRGLAFEYRASWESTFLEPGAVHTLLASVLAPGAWLGGIPIPGPERIAAMRAPGSENAGTWLHLMALTLIALVVLPRLLLAAIAGWRERRQAHRLPLQLEQPYFRRLLRGFHVEPHPVQVVPYAFQPSEAAVAHLETLLTRLVGGAASIQVAPPAAYGDDDDRSLQDLAGVPGPLVLVFNLAATPERETHGAFAQAAKAMATAARPLLVVVDETSFKARTGDEPQRLGQRRDAWRALLQPAGIEPAFVDLAAPDAATVDAAMDAALLVPKR